jgi:hypothetical protein
MNSHDTFQFMPDRRPLRQMFRALWAFNAGFALLLIAAGGVVFVQWITYLGQMEQPNALILAGLVVLFLLMLNALKSAAAAWITSADMRVDQDGIRLALFGTSETLIGWDALNGAKIETQKHPPLLFPLKKGAEAYVIHVPSLGLLFRLTGIEYFQGTRPVFVVTSNHARYEMLLDQIRQKSGSQ